MNTKIKHAHTVRGPYPDHSLIRECLSYDMLFDKLCMLHEDGNSIDLKLISTTHWSRQYELPWSIDVAELKDTDIVLDAGCGYSTTKLMAAKRCKRVIGIDLNLEYLKIAREMCDKLKLDNIELHKADIATYETDLQFDKIFCISAIEHDPSEENKYACLKNMIRLLKPGGTLILSYDVAFEGKRENDFFVDARISSKILQMLGYSSLDLANTKTASFKNEDGQFDIKIYAVCLTFTKQ